MTLEEAKTLLESYDNALIHHGGKMCDDSDCCSIGLNFVKELLAAKALVSRCADSCQHKKQLGVNSEVPVPKTSEKTWQRRLYDQFSVNCWKRKCSGRSSTSHHLCLKEFIEELLQIKDLEAVELVRLERERCGDVANKFLYDRNMNKTKVTPCCKTKHYNAVLRNDIPGGIYRCGLCDQLFDYEGLLTVERGLNQIYFCDKCHISAEILRKQINE